MTDSQGLRSAIKDSGLKYIKIAETLGITTYCLQRKIDNHSEFKASEMLKLSELLGLDSMKRDSIFFA